MKIVDAHHHIWRRADLPWLLGPMQPRIFGRYEPICRDYPIEEYLADIDGTGVERSVYVQANWAPNWAADEAAWVQAQADRTGWPHAVSAYADFSVPDVRPQLDRLARVPLVRGIRQQLHWHEKPAYRFASRPDLVADATLRRNVARLADYGWLFELQVFAPQMPHAGELAAACPNVPFVLQHAGMLEDLSEAGRAEWEAGLKALAAEANVFAKLSGFGTFVHRNDPELIAWIAGRTVKLFGPDRCLFGSNFPIEKIWTSYPDLVAAYRAALDGLPKKAQAAIFHDTAARLYGL
jgi:predicted TIM-barrel fold metal-dependent hydrolase